MSKSFFDEDDAVFADYISQLSTTPQNKPRIRLMTDIQQPTETLEPQTYPRGETPHISHVDESPFDPSCEWKDEPSLANHYDASELLNEPKTESPHRVGLIGAGAAASAAAIAQLDTPKPKAKTTPTLLSKSQLKKQAAENHNAQKKQGPGNQVQCVVKVRLAEDTARLTVINVRADMFSHERQSGLYALYTPSASVAAKSIGNLPLALHRKQSVIVPSSLDALLETLGEDLAFEVRNNRVPHDKCKEYTVELTTTLKQVHGFDSRQGNWL